MSFLILVIGFFLFINGVWSECVDESNYPKPDKNVTAYFSVKGQYPFVGYMAAEEENEFHVKIEKYHGCAASLLNRHWALTTAQCVEPDLQYIFIIGDSQLDSFIRRKYKIVRKFIHPRFGVYHWSGDFNQYNYALVLTNNYIRFDEIVKPIRLSMNNTWQTDPTSKKALVYVGWGKNYHSAVKTQMQRWVAGLYINFEECKKRQRKASVEILEKDHICASSIGDDDLCPSDPGGPMMHIDDDGWTLVGVVSQVLCVSGGATIGAKIERAIPWMRRTMRETSQTELFEDYEKFPIGYRHMAPGPGEDYKYN